jgi:hypothetical protein
MQSWAISRKCPPDDFEADYPPIVRDPTAIDYSRCIVIEDPQHLT